MPASATNQQTSQSLCTASPTTVAPGETVTLDASALDAFYVEFDIDGDGQYERSDETDLIVDVSYDQSGTYAPVVRANGESAEIYSCGQVTVNEPPSASFAVDPRPGTAGEAVTFDASASADSDGTVAEYRWDFEGDGTVDETTADPTTQFSYQQSGGYIPTLTVVDDDGATDTRSNELIVETAPSAVCSAEPTEVAPGETVTLDASGSEARYVEFDIDGDEVYERSDETDFVVEVVYEQPGTYAPVARADGDPDAVDPCGEVVVDENAPPSASFDINPRPGTVGETVTFDASASSDADGTVVEYRWDFEGDGTVDQTTTDPTTLFSYDQQGGYIPTLTVVDDDGATDRAARDYTVETATSAVCRAEPTEVEPGETVTLDASGSEARYVEFDIDGDEVYERSDETDFIVDVSYDQSGTYAPVVRADGDPDAVDPCGEVVVTENAPPSASFAVDPRPGTVGEAVTFDASASADSDGTVIEYRWDFEGDGTVDETTTDPATLFSYEQSGGYIPTLTVVDDDGATDRTARDYTVETASSAVCRAEPTEVEPGETVTLDASGSEASYVEFDIDGDGQYERSDETDFTVEVSYAEPGQYTPTARAGGDSDAVDPCGEILVVENAPPSASFAVDPRPGTVDESVAFDASTSSDADGTVVEYRWDFEGDGTIDETTTDPTAQFSYEQSGGYIPTLTVVDDDGATDRAVRDYTVDTASSAVCSAEPTEVAPGETVTLDASGSEARYVEFDIDGDGQYERSDETDFIVEVVYEQPGTYAPVARADGDPDAVDPCGEVVVDENAPPSASFGINPRPGTVGDSVTFDASASSDADGTVVEYRWDFEGDGTVDETTADPTAQFSYDQQGGYAPVLTVVDDDGATDSRSGDLVVEEDRRLVCAVEPTEVAPGETVTLDASGSEQVVFVEFDVDGDGQYDRSDETDFVVETSYAEPGQYTPSVRAGGVEGPTASCSGIVVSEPTDPGLPLVPIGIGGGGLLGGLGLLYYVFGGGAGGAGGAGTAGGGGGGPSVPKPKPKPSLGSDEKPRYETGVFEIPSSSGSLTVPVGFEPDLVVFSATNGARTDRATDRTAGWSRGIGWRAGGEYVNYGISAADDAQTTDQATCATADTAAIQLFRHESSGPPGRVRVALAGTTADGFEVDVQVPGDDPFASGIRVQYQAIRTATGVEIDVGTFTTPTEPGTQVVDLGVAADHVSLLGSAAVTEPGRLWTTDRGVGLSVGRAVAGEELDQAVSGASAWPGAGHDSAAVSGAGAINLLYQDGPTVAGRTRATVAGVGSELRLRYDRVYNGPHKLGSTARHVVAYLAMDCGESMRPAVGAVPFPGPDERLQVDCGFEPALVSVTVSGAPLGEEVAEWATPQAFGWSEGTAIRDDDGLRQYVLHHAFTPGARTGAPSAAAAAEEAVADGGTADEGPAAAGTKAAGTISVDTAAQSPEATGDSFRIQSPAEVPDDGIVGLFLRQDAEGAVLGRDECRIERVTATGFEVTVDRLETDGPTTTAARPTLLYRAWPAGGSSAGDRTEPAEGTTQGDSEDHQ